MCVYVYEGIYVHVGMYVHIYLPLLLCVFHSWLKLLVLYNLHSGVQAEGTFPFWGVARLMPERKEGEGQTHSGSESFLSKGPRSYLLTLYLANQVALPKLK